MTYSIYPAKILDDVHITSRLQDILREASERFGYLHYAVGFVNHDFHWTFPDSLRSACETIDTLADMGLMGLALTTNRTLVFPDDPETTGRVGVGPPPAKEVVAPILYDSRPTAVLLIDIDEGEKGDSAPAEQLREQVSATAAALGLALDRHPLAEGRLRSMLDGIVEDCVSQTGSKRGYVAIKRLDGGLEYFWPRDTDSGDTFFILRANEGLCGRALQTGEEVNPPDVSAETDYIPSDTAIKSELIVPVKNSAGESIGILNLERTQAGAYPDEMVRYVRKQAIRVVGLAEDFRNLSGEVAPLGGVTLNILNYAGSPEIETFAQFFCDTVKHALNAIDAQPWLRGEDRPLLFPDIVPGYRGRAGMWQTDRGTWVLYAPISMFEDSWCLVGLELASMPSMQTKTWMEHICWIASQALELKRQEQMSHRFENLVRYISLKRDSYRLHEAARVMRDVTSSNHCTIYARSRVNGLEFLGLVASTSQTIFATSAYREMLYRLGRPYDGLTGFVGSTGAGIVETNLSDTTQEYWDAKVEPGFDWTKGMVEREEGRRADIGAFMCHPICRPTDGRLIGVLRLFRSKMPGQRSAFDNMIKERVAFVCETLGAAYGEQGIVEADYFLGDYR